MFTQLGNSFPSQVADHGIWETEVEHQPLKSF